MNQMPPIEIKMRRHLTEEFCSNVLITAFDGAYGGSWYWATSKNRTVVEGEIWRSVKVVDLTSVWPHPILTADHEAVGRGIQMILDDKITGTYIRDAVSRAVLEMDAGDIDAEAADCIIQAALFGKIVYG